MTNKTLYWLWKKRKYDIFMSLGKEKDLTSKKTLYFLIGFYEKYDVINLTISRTLLIKQVVPLLNQVYLDYDFQKNLPVLIGTQEEVLDLIVLLCGNYSGKYFTKKKWINGSLTSNIEYAILPQISILTNAKSIITEAINKNQLIFTLVSTDQKDIGAISHPILGNNFNLKMSKFFLFLLTSLIVVLEAKVSYSSVKKSRNIIKNNFNFGKK